METLRHEGKQELYSKIVDALNDGYLIGKDTTDIHHEIFNTDYFIIGRYEAERWISDNYGIFAAIDKVKEYEMDNFGEVLTDFSEAERLCNMLVYIIGEEILNECDILQDNWNEEISEEINDQLKEYFNDLID